MDLAVYPALPSAAYARKLRARLFSWYRQTHRDLPWRRYRDPYAIWVSEVMLQQTQVATVIPFFIRFLERFPTLATLAAASEQDVLQLWEGLGYYRRARHLHAAAQQIVAEHQGQFPMDPDTLGQLPGMGRYTVGAILSQAFDRPLPVVDANVARILARWFACQTDLRSSPVQAWLWETAARLLPRRKAGTFNQALMELGQTVCIPRQPMCLLCPVAAFCAARQHGMQNRIPVQAPPPARTAVSEVAVVLRRDKAFLLVQRPAHGRWSNMWEFPHGERKNRESAARAAARLALALTGYAVTLLADKTTITHGITRFDIEMTCVLAEATGGGWQSKYYVDHRWLPLAEVAKYPLSRPQRQLATWVETRTS